MQSAALLVCLARAAFAQPADYRKDVHPVLASRCFACHGGDKRSGGLSLKNYTSILEGGRSGEVLVPGEPADSLLLRRVTGETKPQMPPDKPLTVEEIALIRSWIADGARPAPGEAAARRRFQPQLTMQKPPLPEVSWAGWASPLDRLVARYLQERGIAQPAPAAVHRVARRTYLDLWGLLPSPEQLSEYTAGDPTTRQSRLARQLLSHQRNYAEHWISFWNDLLHNEDTMAYHGGERKSITPWLMKALEDNLPMDRFVNALLNPQGSQDPQGFLIGVNWRGDISASQTPAMQAAQNTAQVFLGVNLKCNACHDSFISSWKLRDAYGMAAYFTGDPQLELVKCDAQTGEYTGPKFLYPELEKQAGSSPAERRAAVASMMTSPENGRTPRTIVNRVWAKLFGRGFVDPVDDMDAEPWDPRILDWLAADFAENGYDVRRLLLTIVESRAYQLKSVPRPALMPKKFIFQGPWKRRMTAEQFLDSLSAVTGEWRAAFPAAAKQGVYVRDYRLRPTALSLALGRPTREQVVTERSDEATMLQALALVNGGDLFQLLSRGSRRMLGEMPPAPVPVWFSSVVTQGSVKNPPAVDVDILSAGSLWLLTADQGSYDPAQSYPMWRDARLVKADGREVPFTDLAVRRTGSGVEQTWTLDIKDLGFTRFRATATLEPRSLRSDINPALRFFVFTTQPERDRLLPVSPELPVAAPEGPFTDESLTRRVFSHMLGRPATPTEARIARKALHEGADRRLSASGLADLLWSLAMTPEFQLIL